MSSEMDAAIRAGELSYDPKKQKLAAALKAWKLAAANLSAAKAELAHEENRWNGRRSILEQAITEQKNVAQPIFNREQETIAKSKALIAEYEASIEAARSTLTKETAEAEVKLAGLRSNVAVAQEVDDRVDAELTAVTEKYR